MLLDTLYKSPTHKLLKWFKESRDNWKTKYQELKKNFKQLENRIRFLESSKNRWKKEAIELRAILKKNKKKSKSLKLPELTFHQLKKKKILILLLATVI